MAQNKLAIVIDVDIFQNVQRYKQICEMYLSVCMLYQNML